MQIYISSELEFSHFAQWRSFVSLFYKFSICCHLLLDIFWQNQRLTDYSIVLHTKFAVGCPHYSRLLSQLIYLQHKFDHVQFQHKKISPCNTASHESAMSVSLHHFLVTHIHCLCSGADQPMSPFTAAL